MRGYTLKMAIKREAKFTQLFRHWLKANPMYSSAFELKQTTTNSIPFSNVQEHQLHALQAAKKDGLLYKAPDDSAGSKPFDLFYLRHAYAWVVIKYPKAFYLIDVDMFMHEKALSARRSLTAQRAAEIAAYEVPLTGIVRQSKMG